MAVQRYELNPDESQIIAGALTLISDAVPWRSLDAMTTGPLSDYWLALASWFAPLDFLVARLWAVVTFGGALILTYATLRRLTNDTVARWAVLPALLFVTFTTHHDYTHYSSEHLPCLLIAAAVYGLVRMMQGGTERGRVAWGFAAAVLLGAQPWAKLQMVPVALPLGILGLVWWAARPTLQWRKRLAGALAMLAGSLLPSIVFVTLILANGLWSDFTARYIGYVFDYAESRPQMALELLMNFGRYAGPNSGMIWLAGGALLWITLALGRWWDRGRFIGRFWGFSLAIAYALSAFATCLISGRYYTHYLLMLVLPVAFLSGWILFYVTTRGVVYPVRHSFLSLKPYTLFFVLLVLPVLVRRPFIPQPTMPVMLPHRDDAVSYKINEVATPGDRLTTWGWMPEYNVRTHLAQGARDAISVNLMEPSPRQEQATRDYVADLERNHTRFFVDAVAPGAFAYSTPEWRHDHFSIVREYIATHYRLLDEHDGIRIYVRARATGGLTSTVHEVPRI
jgi:hypothetical protein